MRLQTLPTCACKRSQHAPANAPNMRLQTLPTCACKRSQHAPANAQNMRLQTECSNGVTTCASHRMGSLHAPHIEWPHYIRRIYMLSAFFRADFVFVHISLSAKCIFLHPLLKMAFLTATVD